MRFLIDWPFRGRWHALAASCVAAGVLSTLIYWFDWWKYYDGIRRILESEQQIFATQIASLYQDTGDVEHDRRDFEVRLPAILAALVAEATVIRIEGRSQESIARSPDYDPEPDRTVVEQTFDLASLNAGLKGYQFRIARTNRPPLSAALWRAWSFSLLDLLQGPRNWWERRLYMRSLPLWIPFLLISLGLWLLLTQIARTVEARTTAVRLQLGHLVNCLTRQLDTRNQQVHDAEASCASLRQALQEVEHHEAEAVAALRTEIEEKQREINRIRQDENEYAQLLDDASRELRGIDPMVNIGKQFVNWLGRVQSAEEFVKRLGAGIADRVEIEQTDSRFRRLEQHLRDWISHRASGPERHWSEHSRAREVVDAFERIDPEFCSQFFVSARNGRYQPQLRRTIGVISEQESGSWGELEVVLDDDAGRTLCLKYELRHKKAVPAVEKVGFALAILLRAVHKDFGGFRIR